MIEMTLPAMNCEHCVRTITRTVQRVDPSATVEIDLPTRRVRIGSGGNAAAFRVALADEGYEAAPPGAA
jgi:copper chaperone CopZ